MEVSHPSYPCWPSVVTSPAQTDPVTLLSGLRLVIESLALVLVIPAPPTQELLTALPNNTVASTKEDATRRPHLYHVNPPSRVTD